MTNYTIDKPSIGFTTKTTQFDDELLKRGTITFEQAMMAKGATLQEAQRLSDLKKAEQLEDKAVTKISDYKIERGSSEGDDIVSSESDDDTFRAKWRDMRIAQLKEEQSKARFGEVLPIQRSEWNREVNEASEDGTWVVVHLSSQNSSPNLHPIHLEMCNLFEEQLLPQLASNFPAAKFVTLPARSAVPNWPDEKLPTLFCYQYGKLAHQLVGWEALGGGMLSAERIEWRLSQLGIIETDLDEEPKRGELKSKNFGNEMKSHFGGKMATLVTNNSSCDDDYDDVD